MRDEKEQGAACARQAGRWWQARRHTLRAVVIAGGTLLLAAAAWLLLTTGAVTPSFLFAAAIFCLVFAAISLRWMHETAAALSGIVAMWLVHYVGGTWTPALRVISFEEAMAFVDWNVIFLILGMMVFMAMFSETGIFNWLAFRAFQFARGNAWVLGIALVLLTGIVSAFLNDVTAILLLVPLSIEIAETVGVHPFAYVIPEVLASNIGGAATLIGDPPSTIVGSHLSLSFVEYLRTMAPIALLCLVLLLVITSLLYRREFITARTRLSPILVERIEADARITDVGLLRKAGLVGVATVALFFTEDLFGMPPSVVALTGAAVLVVWVRPDMHRMLREVDWTTLVFFIGIFCLVGALEATGVIDAMASIIGKWAGDSLVAATVLMVWVPGMASAVVANIPFTVAALPIADYLSATVPGAQNLVIYWALILGADLGGNATYLGSAPNIVAVGLLAQAGYRLGFGRFMRDGVPVTLLTLSAATLWLLVRR
ncbi:MAG: anion permease [Anaerolineae bacterium]|nr:anion permease [Anaerolineae bacterium]